MKDPIAINLRKIGLKITPQRQAILKLLKGNQTHPSAERIYSKILKKYPGISFATVYNTLSKLVEAGEIQFVPEPLRRPERRVSHRNGGEEPLLHWQERGDIPVRRNLTRQLHL